MSPSRHISSPNRLSRLLRRYELAVFYVIAFPLFHAAEHAFPAYCIPHGIIPAGLIIAIGLDDIRHRFAR